MGKKELILQELEEASDPLINEVLDYVRFLKLKRNRRHLDTAIASESSLKKDWLRPEEEKAWQDL